MCREHDPRQVPATSHNLTQPLASLALDTCLLKMRPKCIQKRGVLDNTCRKQQVPKYYKSTADSELAKKKKAKYWMDKRAKSCQQQSDFNNVRMRASRGQKRQCTQYRTATDLAFHNRQP